MRAGLAFHRLFDSWPPLQAVGWQLGLKGFHATKFTAKRQQREGENNTTFEEDLGQRCCGVGLKRLYPKRRKAQQENAEGNAGAQQEPGMVAHNAGNDKGTLTTVPAGKKQKKKEAENKKGETPVLVVVVPQQDPCQIEQFPIPRFQEKMQAFQKLCDKHRVFLTHCRAVDKYLLSMVLVYFERAHLTAIGFTKDRYLFYALFLAMEMEEDSLDGLTEIIEYTVGAAPCTLAGYQVGDKAQDRWDARLSKFYKGKDSFWSRLKYRAFVDREECFAIAQSFPSHAVFSRMRSTKELESFRHY